MNLTEREKEMLKGMIDRGESLPPRYRLPLFANVPEHLRAIWRWLNALDADALLGEGRVYGGGLHNLEPKERANLPVGTLLDQFQPRKEHWQQPTLV